MWWGARWGHPGLVDSRAAATLWRPDRAGPTQEAHARGDRARNLSSRLETNNNNHGTRTQVQVQVYVQASDLASALL